MRHLLILVIGSLFFLTGCSSEDGGAGTLSTVAPMEAEFDLANSVIPFPNNILFADSPDGTLNIPVVDQNDFSDPKVAMNTLDGFSTIAPMSTTFSKPIDATTVAAGVRVFEVATLDIYSSYAVTGIAAKLVFGTQFVAFPSPDDATTLVVKPIVPLKSNTNYMVVVTNALKSTSGDMARTSLGFEVLKKTTALVDGLGVSQVPGVDDATALQLEGLRQLTQAMLGVAGAAVPAIAAADVAITWSFKTQTINKVLARVQANSGADPYATNAVNFITAGAFDFYSFAQGDTTLIDAYTASPTSFDTIGSVITGEVNLPYYLDDNSVNPLGPVTGTFNIIDVYGTPQTKSVQAVPFLMTTPDVTMPGPWPVVIFQHGFTVDKSAMFGIANTLAKGGFATIAIDSVLHGDRTFGLDLANNVTGDAGSDGTADTSGQHYLNLSSLLTARDNIRQSVADLIHLTRLLEVQTIDVVNNGTGLPLGAGDGADLIVGGAAPVSYVGHSNGGILGTVLAGIEPAINTFVLVNPGGDYGSIFKDSLSLSPLIDAGLSAKGVTIGSPDYNAFFVAAQTVVGDGDPINYATLAAAKNILMFKMLDDAVVPNAQTDALALVFGMKQVEATGGASTWPLGANASPFAGSGFTFFTQGTHSSFLTPDPLGLIGLDVITEMQSETVNYLGSALLGAATVMIGATPLPSTNPASSVVQ